MRVRKGLLWIAGCIIAVTACLFLFMYQPQDVVHINKVKRKLVAIANDAHSTQERVAKIKHDAQHGWTDGQVGVTADGYVFFYDLHESHGMDNISDIHILYLPDEQRFLISHIPHFCCDLSKFAQVKNKCEVVKLFRYP